VSDLPTRETERLADLGVARMLAALAGVHVLAGAAAAVVLTRTPGLVVGAADAVAAVVLLGAGVLALRLGAGARGPVAGGGRRFDLALVATALGVTCVATALRVVATGSVWVGLELPLVVVAAAALPRRHAVAVALATLAAAGGAVAAVAARGPRTAPELLGTLLPLAVLPAAAAVAVAWRRRVALLTARLLAAHESAQADAVRDQLTGAVNRRGLDMVAAPMVENARRQGEAAHCLFVDVDGFREVNERHGAAVGDAVLRAVAAALAAGVRTTDVVGRWTGDEFVVVGPGTGTSPLELERRVHASLAAEPPVPPELWSARVSIGSATLVPWDEGDLAALLRRAEQDMRLRRSLRRQRSERTGPEITAPAHRPVAGGTESQPGH
jgi:diguanylate cyclase (GGDEF)-like protein